LLNSLPKQARRLRIGEYTIVLDTIKLIVSFVEDEFRFQVTTLEAFLLAITLLYIQTAISRYKNKISVVSKRSIYYYCGRLIAARDIYKVYEEAYFNLPLQETLDYYSRYKNY
jgi:hypothetical protein